MAMVELEASYSGLNRCQLLGLILLFEFKMLSAFILPPFFWSPRNPYFHENKCGDHAHWYVNSGYYLNVICPSAALPPKHLPDHIPRYKLFENMFIVSKEEFDSCTLDQKKHPRSRALMYCDKSQTEDLQYRTLHFKPVRAWSGGLAFPVNKTYYFIGTGNGTYRGVKNTAGGRCKTDNMKLAITVCGWDCSKCHDFCCPNSKNLTTTVVTTIAKRTTIANSKPSPSTKENITTATQQLTQKVTEQNEGMFKTKKYFSKVEIDNRVEHDNSDGSLNSASFPKKAKQTGSNNSFGSQNTAKSTWMMFSIGVVVGIVVVVLIYFIIIKGPKLKRIWCKHSQEKKPYKYGYNHREGTNSLKRLVSHTGSTMSGSSGGSGDASPAVEPTTPVDPIPPTVGNSLYHTSCTGV